MAENTSNPLPPSEPVDDPAEKKHRHDIRVAFWIMALMLSVFFILAGLLWFYHFPQIEP